MQNDLEKYLQQQREAMDVERPDEALIWEGIRADLQQDKGSPGDGPDRGRRLVRYRVLRAAAVVAFLLSLGYVAMDLVHDQRDDRGYGTTLASVDPELGEREEAYMALVAEKWENPSIRSAGDNPLIAELLEEISRLDTIYETTMKDLQELGPDERVINTLFDTYEKKIFLLELIILETQKAKDYENNDKIFL